MHICRNHGGIRDTRRKHCKKTTGDHCENRAMYGEKDSMNDFKQNLSLRRKYFLNKNVKSPYGAIRFNVVQRGALRCGVKG
jgi:hypothetical protein